MRQPSLVALVLVLSAIAGCVSGDADSTSVTITDRPVENGGGTISGLVVSDELVPIPGAIVGVEGVSPATTDEAGRFMVSGLPIGVALRVEVLALGFEAVAQSVTIEGEEAPVEIQFVLARLASTTPYTELVISTGFEICTVTLGVTVQRINPCPLGQPSPPPVGNASDSWRYLVVETDWDTQDVFWLYISHERGCISSDPCWGNAVGRAPVRVDGAPNDAALAARYALDGKKTYPEGAFEFYISPVYAGMFRDDINNTAGPYCVTLIVTLLGPLGQQWNPNLGCGLGYGVSTGIKYTNYISLFHFARPENPAGYSGMPDQ